MLIVILVIVLILLFLLNLWLYKSVIDYLNMIKVKDNIIDKMIKDINAVKRVCFEHYNKIKDEDFIDKIIKIIGRP